MLRSIKNWLVKDSGATAVEFALVGLPFITMLIGMVEISLFFASGVILEGASNDAARMIRTGQVQTSGNPVQTFEDELCNKVSLLISCGDLQYEVLGVPNNSFSNADAMQPQFDADGNLVSGGFSPGGSSDDILIRVVYRYEFLTPFLGAMMAQDSTTNTSILMSTLVIKNEPYKFGG